MPRKLTDEIKETRVLGGRPNVVTTASLEQISGLERTTALERATAAIDELAGRHPELGAADGAVHEGAGEIFWRSYGPRAIYHHWREGTHLLYGEILEAYRAVDGAEPDGAGATLGPPTSGEIWADPIKVAAANDPNGTVVTPRVVHFREGRITWSQEQGISVTRTTNSTCRLRWNFEIIEQRSGLDWHDNDWLCAVWTVNDVAHPQTIALRDLRGSTEIHGDRANPAGRTPIAPIDDHVVCNRHDLVTVTYVVVNLSGIGYQQQIEQATGFTGDLLAWIVPKWLQLAEVVLTIVPGAGPVAGSIAGLLPEYRDDITKALGTVWSEAGAPAVMKIAGVVETALGALGKRANCSGPIMHDFVIFEPLKPLDLTIDKTYTAERATRCRTPQTRVTLEMSRTV